MIDQDEQVVLVDETDREIGHMAKLEAHRKGLLHRAISVFVFDEQGRLIIQRRAKSKYHSGGQWANTCCSHPRPGESTERAAHRRLVEELDFDCDLVYRTGLRYRADVGSGLVENEMVSAYVGLYDGAISPNASEVSQWRAISPSDLAQAVARDPNEFTPWLRIYVEQHFEALFPAGAQASAPAK